MCRGHSFNGTWTDAGVADCEAALLEVYTFADDTALARIGVRHLKLGMGDVRPEVSHSHTAYCSTSSIH